MLFVRLGDKRDLQWAQDKVKQEHYLHQRVDPRARPMVYLVEDLAGTRLGLVMVSIPHATRCRGWWGYPGLPTQWQVVDICRIWLDPIIQPGGHWAHLAPGFVDRRGIYRPTAASWVIGQVLERVQRDRVAMWPPVYPHLPYHIRLVISYHDPQYHRGTIYRAAGAAPMYADAVGSPIPGSAGKFGWCWRLPEPQWSWTEIRILQPRTLRLPI